MSELCPDFNESLTLSQKIEMVFGMASTHFYRSATLIHNLQNLMVIKKILYNALQNYFTP